MFLDLLDPRIEMAKEDLFELELLQTVRDRAVPLSSIAEGGKNHSNPYCRKYFDHKDRVILFHFRTSQTTVRRKEIEPDLAPPYASLWGSSFSGLTGSHRGKHEL